MNSNTKPGSEKLLYKLILQFAIHTQGTNKLLDPHLKTISQSLKGGINYHQLNPELLSLSKTLAHISLSAKQENIAIESSDKKDQSYFLNHLNQLLNITDVPLKFTTQCSVLKQKIQKDLDDVTFKQIVDSATSLLLKITKHQQTEQLDIEKFFTELPNQLGLLEKDTLKVSKSNEESIENRKNLNSAIKLQVNNIKNSSESAKELTTLQQNITLYVQELSSQLQTHKDAEDNRQRETQEQLESMSQKILDMEIETETLRNNLKLAHDKALKDALTNLPNRLAYDERISIEYNRWSRYQEPLTIIIWDIDLFKIINDKYGHKAGDKTLALVAQLIEKNSRDTDFVARFGGEEFIMLLPKTTSQQAFLPAEKIRKVIAKAGINHNGESIKLTISCGISEFSEGDNVEDVFERADKALYISKDEGRNKCSILNKES